MRNPVRSWIVLALAAAAEAAAAGERFVPADPAFVVAAIGASSPDRELRTLVAQWRALPTDSASVTLARALLARATERREPMFLGRAEAVLATAVAKTGASDTVKRLYAETLQRRHEFGRAESLLSTLLDTAPRDAAARLQRASIRLVRGDFAGAQHDCARVLAQGSGELAALACMAQARAGSGGLDVARALLTREPLGLTQASVFERAYFLAVRGELFERSLDLDRAIADYSVALTLTPGDDSIRGALADALVARGEGHEASALLEVARPGLALRVRRAAYAGDASREKLREEAAAALRLEAARADTPHYREQAMLALALGDEQGALAAAEANFSVQRELTDVRLLARAAVAVGNTPARRRLEQWLRTTGFRDGVTESILGAGMRG